MAVQIILKNSSAEDKRPTAPQLANGEIALNYNAAGSFLTCKDTDGNIQQVGGVKISEVAPESPVKQTLWFQPSSLKLFVYDGDSYLPIAGGDGGGGTPGGGITTIVGDFGIDASTTEGVATLIVDLAGGDDGLEFDVGRLKASIASDSQLGSVKIGDGIDVALDGTISVDIPQTLTFRGSVDLGQPPAGQINPDPPRTGDAYVASFGANPIDAGWTGIGGDVAVAGDLAVFDGNNWELIATGGTMQDIEGGDGIQASTAAGIATVAVDLAGGDDGLEFDSTDTDNVKLKASIASDTQLGSVKVGDGLSADAAGVLSVDGAPDLGDGDGATLDGRYVKIVGDATAQTITGTGGLKTEGLLESAGGVKVSGASADGYAYFTDQTEPNFFLGDTYIGGSTTRNTLELWKSTLTEEQLEQLEAGTLVAPANVATPGDGEFARAWYYDQQDAETQALLDLGELEYPEHLAAATFTDTFALGDNTNINLLSRGTIVSNISGPDSFVVSRNNSISPRVEILRNGNNRSTERLFAIGTADYPFDSNSNEKFNDGVFNISADGSIYSAGNSQNYFAGSIYIGGDTTALGDNTNINLNSDGSSRFALDANIHGLTVGRGAGAIDTNTAVGNGALNTNTTGRSNTANGASALQNNTEGDHNTATGNNALFSNTTGGDNTANGVRALYNNTFGSSNTANGVNALFSNTIGVSNTATGRNALRSNITGNNNTANGRSALFENTAGNSNTANGISALQGNIEGNSNTANGANVLYSNITGNSNTANGASALFDNTTGNNNTANGVSALIRNTTGNENTAIGYEAGKVKQDGSNATDFDNCTSLGADTRCSGSNQVQLGNSATTTFAYGAVQDRSDARDKTDIRDTLLGLDFVNSLRPVDFRWDYRDDYFNKEEVTLKDGTVETKLVPVTKDGSRSRDRFHHGLIAQEVKAAADAQGVDFAGYQDHSVNGGLDVLSIGYTEMIAPLIKAVQELSAENAELKKRLDDAGL